jgi:hypothetical protein
MAKIVEHVHDSGDSGMGFFLGILLLIGFLAFMFYWGLPYVRNFASQQQNGGVQIQVPDKIDVNVVQQQQQPAQ